VLVIAQFWSFANDLHSEEQGKRLFAILGFGQTSGAIAGSALASWLLPRLGAYPLMLVAAGLLVAALALANLIHRGSREVARAPSAAAPASTRGGLKLVLASRYLLLVALLTLVYNTVNSNGEFILGTTVVEHARAAAATVDGQQRIIGAFYGGYFGAVNVLTALLQLFAVSRIFKYGGVRIALLVMPAISLGGYAMIATVPILGLMRLTKIAENATDYSLQNTTRQALFLPTSRAEKYQAKAAIDTLFVRFGDVAALGLIALIPGVLGLGVKALALVNVALVLTWIALALALGRRYPRARAVA
jgi:AAA family ATP:ADP antiporter